MLVARCCARMVHMKCRLGMGTGRRTQQQIKQYVIPLNCQSGKAMRTRCDSPINSTARFHLLTSVAVLVFGLRDQTLQED